MPIEHTVVQGDTTIALAEKHGHFADTIWNDSANAALKAKRQDMSVLLPGDVIVIPDLRPKSVSKAPEQRHRFRRKGVPVKLRLQLFQGGKPRANQEFRLSVDGAVQTGMADGDGRIDVFVSPRARRGQLVIGDDRATYDLAFGHMDPVDEISGVQKRLANLGLFGGAITGELDDLTRLAVRDFQARVGLPVSGEPDAATRRKLVQAQDEPGAPLPRRASGGAA